MGRLKDNLYLEVWKHLKVQRNCSTLLPSLNLPATGPRTLRGAWADLQSHRELEGLKKKTGLKEVLAERPDLFAFVMDDRGHLLIELTHQARALEPTVDCLEMSARSLAPVASPLMPAIGPTAPPVGGAGVDIDGWRPAVGEDAVLALANAAAGGSSSSSARADDDVDSSVVGSGPVLPVGAINAAARAAVAGAVAAGGEPAKKKQKTSSTASFRPVEDGWMPQRDASGYFRDIIWTPELAARRELAKKKERDLVWALYAACESHGGNRQPVTLSQLGSDFQVAQLKKEPQFKNLKLADMMKHYEDVFDVAQAPEGMMVRLKPGAQAQLPDAAEHLEAQMKDNKLPPRIEDAQTPKQKMQALRIELVYTLHKRGGKCALQECGQDPRLQKAKQAWGQAKKLLEFLRIFPYNFDVKTEGAQTMVTLLNYDVSDQGMIDHSLARQPVHTSFGKGRGRGIGSSPRPAAPSAGAGGNQYWQQQQQHLQQSAALQVAAGYGQAMLSSAYSYPYGFSPAPTGFSSAPPQATAFQIPRI